VFGRQIPRPDCLAPFARDYDRCFGPQRESVHWDHFFSMVSSGLRRDAWSRRGFIETMQYSEDDEYTRWCRAHGYQIRYVPDSVVMHSHNYTPRQAFKRSFGEAWALAAVSEESPGAAHDSPRRRRLAARCRARFRFLPPPRSGGAVARLAFRALAATPGTAARLSRGLADAPC